MRTYRRILLTAFLCLLVSGCSFGDTPTAATPDPTSTTPATNGTPFAIESLAGVKEPPTPRRATLTIARPATATAAKADFELVSSHDYVASFGGGEHVVGIFRYNGAVPAVAPEIVVTLRDASGGIVGTQRAITSPTMVQPGKLVPFRASFFDEALEWASYGAEIQAKLQDNINQTFYYDEYEVIESSLLPKSEISRGPRIVGTVKNIGTKTGASLQVIGILYDAQDKVLDVSGGYSLLGDVLPSATSTFEISFDNNVQAARYELIATAYSTQ